MRRPALALLLGCLLLVAGASALDGYDYYQTIEYAACDQEIYQQDIVIHRTTGTAYNETAGGLETWHIYVGDHCREDYGDIRFTNSTGELAYYLWPDYDSSSARFCVRLEGADQSGALVIWYGNPTATTTSDAGAAPAQYLVPGEHTYTVPSGVTSVSVLVVGGGGGGGAGAGGGGGAGGLIYQTGYSVTPGASLSVTVGAGGPGTANEAARGTSGGNSVFNDLVAIGGGGGGSYHSKSGLLGGSGGGAANGGSPGSGTAGQGYGGGSGNNLLGGGGGGAGAVGGSLGQPGGIGVAVPITGQFVYYAGGGGPGSNRAGYIPGGLGGGGRGNSGVGENGTDGLGGGGGGAGSNLLGGSGGSGIVIVRTYSATPPSVSTFSGGQQTAAPPTAQFTASPTLGPRPLTVQFADTSTNTPTSWLWDFGDGATATEQNPTHTYTAPGLYTVTLTATNEYGSDTLTKTDHIDVGDPPAAQFTATPPTGYAPLTVQFADTSTNTPTSWLWDFGDGATTTEQNPTHTYQNIGTYTATLTATNKYGSGTTTTTISAHTIHPFPGIPNKPRDPTGTGLYTDINGNGRLDYNDLTVFFQNLAWTKTNQPLDAFDFNQNSRLDFDDVIILYQVIINA